MSGASRSRVGIEFSQSFTLVFPCILVHPFGIDTLAKPAFEFVPHFPKLRVGSQILALIRVRFNVKQLVGVIWIVHIFEPSSSEHERAATRPVSMVLAEHRSIRVRVAFAA